MIVPRGHHALDAAAAAIHDAAEAVRPAGFRVAFATLAPQRRDALRAQAAGALGAGLRALGEYALAYEVEQAAHGEIAPY